MLTMTDNAVLVIRDLAAQQAVSDGGGLRIAADADAGSLTVELVEQPVQGEEPVVDTEGARIFLDPDAAELLNDTSVDASVDDEGIVQFGFTEKPAHEADPGRRRRPAVDEDPVPSRPEQRGSGVVTGRRGIIQSRVVSSTGQPCTATTLNGTRVASGQRVCVRTVPLGKEPDDAAGGPGSPSRCRSP